MSEIKNWKKSFFTIYLGQGFSILSSSVVQFSIIWWITLTTGSPLAITIATVAGLLPQAIIGPFAGVWIDRLNRKAIMIVADGVVALGSAILFLAFLFGTPPMWLVYGVLFIRALGETFHKPSLNTIIPQLVPKDNLTKAGGLGQLISSACNILGPMLGGLLMSITTLGIAMLVDIVGAMMAIITLCAVKIPKQSSLQGEKTNVWQDMKKGVVAMKQNKALMRIFIPFFLTTIIFVPIGTMLPLMVKNYFGGNAWHNSLVQTLFSVGTLVTAGLIGVTGGMKKQFLMISISISVLGVFSVLAGFVPANLFWMFCICVFVIGGCGMCFNIPFTSYIQKTISEENLGKVMSFITSILSFAAPIGMFVSGPIAEIVGVSNWMRGAGVIMIIVGIISYLLTREFDGKEEVN